MASMVLDFSVQPPEQLRTFMAHFPAICHRQRKDAVFHNMHEKHRRRIRRGIPSLEGKGRLAAYRTTCAMLENQEAPVTRGRL